MAEEKGGSSIQGFLWGFAAGAVVGGVLGILLAPQSGAETRAQIREQALRTRERARSLGETGQELLRDAVAEGREAAGRARQQMDEWVRRGRGETGSAPQGGPAR